MKIFNSFVCVLCFSSIAFCEIKNLPVLNLPSTIGELQEATRGYPELVEFGKNPEVLTFGSQSLLFTDKLPLVKVKEVEWAEKFSGHPLKILVVSTLQLEGELFYLPSALDAKWIRIPALYPTMYDYLGDKQKYISYFSLKLLKKALEENPDVIVLTTSASSFPEEVHKKIISYVKENGKGLILCGVNSYGWYGTWWEKQYGEVNPIIGSSGDKQRFKDMDSIVTDDWIHFGGIPWDILPPISLYKNLSLTKDSKPVWYTKTGIPLAGIKEIGSSRIVALGWSGMFPEVGRYMSVNPEAEDDLVSGIKSFERYFSSIFCKLVLYAAGRKPLAWAIFNSNEKLVFGEKNKITFNLEGELKEVDKLKVTVRDMNFNTVLEKYINPMKENVLELPDIASGKYVLDVVIKDKNDCVISWYSHSFKIENPLNLKIETDKEIYLPGEIVEIKGRVEGLEKFLKKIKLVIDIEDVEGHILYRETLTLEKEEFFAKYKTIKTDSSIQKIIVYVFDGNRKVCFKEKEISVSSHKWEDFYNILWGTTHLPSLGLEFSKVLNQKAGIDVFLVGGYPEERPIQRLILNSGFPIFWTNWFPIYPWELEKDYSKVIKNLENKIPYFHRHLNKYGGIAVCVQDERHALKETIPGEEVLKMFQKYLKEKYKDIKNLNTAWETNFSSFDEVKPASEKDIKETTYNISSWLEYRIWFSKLITDVDKMIMDKAIDGLVDKDIYYGIEGLFELGEHIIPYSGFDYSSSPFNILMPYGRNVVNLSRSFCSGPVSTWAGYGQDKNQYYTTPWWGLLHGYWGMSWFCGKTFVSDIGGLYPQHKWVKETTEPLRKGIGKLIMQLKEEIDPVVFLYSQPSIYTTYIMGHWVNPENTHLFLRPFNASRTALQRFLSENGINYRYISEEQIQNGFLKDKKLLILSCCFSLSPKTCEEIKTWVKEGGIVIADVRPAIFDDRGVPYEGLNDLFGVKNKKFEWGLQPFDYLVWAKETVPDWNLKGWLVAEYYEKSLEVIDGKNLGEIIFEKDKKQIPCFIYKQYGKGKVLLLNFLLTAYSRKQDTWSVQLSKEILNFAGITPRHQVCNEKKVPLLGHEVIEWKDGETSYLGIFREENCDPLLPSKVYFFFEKPSHNYLFGGVEPISGEIIKPLYLGYSEKVEINISPGGVVLLARLPYKLDKIKTDLKKIKRLPDETEIDVELVSSNGEISGISIINMEVFNPYGEIEKSFCKNFVIKNGKGKLTIPFFINSPKGKWKVILTEVVSGIKNEITLNLN
ncbi:MAG: beta-galactosidase [Candidatus Omnitrophica bacterium]|nr:beta-galactosidase [Candidatus Omnitrophota bacterium]MCM8801819.1 beta-galactosidase [Candidatus Omnitrophota bacterium]